MCNPTAISLVNVSKVYRRYNNVVDQAIDVLGLARFFFWRKLSSSNVSALRNVSLEVGRGERIGVVGRNGAGKTTLLKLMTGNFLPTSGTVQVNGTVQALMSVGLGFHPEFSGYENIQSSLVYNGLSRLELKAAVEEIIDFIELGDFLYQPMKTYSMGMQARLMFATATAVKPDILVIDEVLGAGDAYFAAKSAHRMERLAKSGCTLLLVSHSMQQVLQFCDHAIWLEDGAIVLEGESLRVVKAYEEFAQKLETAQIEAEAQEQGEAAAVAPGAGNVSGLPPRASVLQNNWLRERILDQVLAGATESEESNDRDGTSVSVGGVSRWGGGEPGLKIAAVRLLDDYNSTIRTVYSGAPLNIEFEVLAEETGEYPCYFVILLFAQDGRWLTRHCSQRYELGLDKGQRRKMRLRYPQNLLGSGTYYFSAAIYKSLDLNKLNTAKFYDLLSRSFEFRVIGPYCTDLSVFYHPADWVLDEENVS